MFDKSTVDNLVADLETAEAALSGATDNNTSAQMAAAKAQADLNSAQSANRDAVQAIKSYFDTLDQDGNLVSPSPTGTGDPTIGTQDVTNSTTITGSPTSIQANHPGTAGAPGTV